VHRFSLEAKAVRIKLNARHRAAGWNAWLTFAILARVGAAALTTRPKGTDFTGFLLRPFTLSC